MKNPVSRYKQDTGRTSTEREDAMLLNRFERNLYNKAIEKVKKDLEDIYVPRNEHEEDMLLENSIPIYRKLIYQHLVYISNGKTDISKLYEAFILLNERLETKKLAHFEGFRISYNTFHKIFTQTGIKIQTSFKTKRGMWKTKTEDKLPRYSKKTVLMVWCFLIVNVELINPIEKIEQEKRIMISKLENSMAQ
jgi:hypothetical protein